VLHARRLALAACLSLVAATAAPAARADATVVREEIQLPISLTVNGDCLNEAIQVNATAVIRRLGVVDDNGGAHRSSRTAYVDATAVGVDSGTEYLVVRRSVLTSSESGGSDEHEFTLVVILQLIAPGADQDVHLRITRHVTTDGTGDAVIEFTNSELWCTS
jgi:hypothetical protein